MQSIIQVLTNPAILSLMIGLFLGIGQLLTIPERLSSFVALYLIFCIGLKGGLCLGVANACTPPLIGLALIGAIIGFIQPFFNYAALKKITSLDRQTTIVIASQFGSISIVTYLNAITFLQQRETTYDTFMAAIAGMMEIPAIFAGLLLLKGMRGGKGSMLASIADVTKRILSCKKISFLFLGFIAGTLLRNYHNSPLIQLTLWPFTFLLIIFMIDIGIMIAQQRRYIHHFSWSLIGFAIITPIIMGSIGLAVCYLMSIGIGSTLLFSLLLASASYIAVPAVMRAQAPGAKEVIYLPLALGITLPFNVLISTPILYDLILRWW